MKNKMVKCSGGCGRTQDVIIRPKGSDGFTASRPWTCAACSEKEAKRKAKAEQARSAPETKAKPDKGFIARPRRVATTVTSVQRETEVPSGRTPSQPAAQSEQVPASEPEPVGEGAPAGESLPATDPASIA